MLFFKNSTDRALAIRHAKDIANLDLKNCQQWNRFLEVISACMGLSALNLFYFTCLKQDLCFAYSYMLISVYHINSFFFNMVTWIISQ